MKKIFLVLAFLTCTLSSVAQSPKTLTPFPREVRAIEGEIGFGIRFGAPKLGFDETIGFTCQIEMRYNLPRLPLDFGIQASMGTLNRFRSPIDPSLPSWLRDDDVWIKSWNVLVVSDYTWRRTKRVSFFAGLGLGYAHFDATAPISEYVSEDPYYYALSAGDPKNGICVMPRIGIEFFHHLRLTLDYKFQERANRHFNISIGGVFGGGKKKYKTQD